MLAALAALAMSWATPSLEAASSLEPGVHVDPGSPAAKEYALPLNQARQTGGGSSPQSSSEGALFGAGIKPPSSGSPRGGGRSGAHTAAGGAVIGSGSQTALAEDVLRAARAHESASGDGSLLALIGGGVAILVLGGFGGTVLRHGRRATSSSISDAG